MFLLSNVVVSEVEGRVWSLQGHGLGQNEGEVVNVPFPLCETDDDERTLMRSDRICRKVLIAFMKFC